MAGMLDLGQTGVQCGLHQGLLSDADVALLATTAWTSLRPAA
jgi:hypothetical protein